MKPRNNSLKSFLSIFSDSSHGPYIIQKNLFIIIYNDSSGNSKMSINNSKKDIRIMNRSEILVRLFILCSGTDDHTSLSSFVLV